MAPSGTEAKLLAHLRAHPDDLDARRVHADLLLGSANPIDIARGELVSLAFERERSPYKRTIDRRSRQILEEHRDVLLGPFGGPMGGHPSEVMSWKLQWAYGMVHSVHIEQQMFSTPPRVSTLVQAIAELPVMALLVELSLSLGLVEANAPELQRIVDAIVAGGRPLRRLVLQGFADPWGETFAPQSRADTSALLPSLPWLEHLEIEGEAVVYGELRSPRLRECRLTGALRVDQLERIGTSRLPALETLVVGGGDGASPAEAMRCLRPVLEESTAPKLRHLGFDLYRPPEHWRSFWPALLQTKIISQLEVLEVSPIDEAASESVVASRAAVAHLQRLAIHNPPHHLEHTKALCRWVDLGETRLERGARFCEVDLDEPEVFVREGEIGAAGVRQQISLECWPAFHEEIERRRLQGYVLRSQRARGREEIPHESLWSAVLASPSDREALLAWGQFNRSWEVPRSELISLQCALALDPGDAALLRRERELLQEESQTLLGPLAEHMEPGCSPRLSLTWRYGYIRAARIESLVPTFLAPKPVSREVTSARVQPNGLGTELMSMHSRAWSLDGDNDPLSVAELVEELLSHPSGCLIEELEVVLSTPAQRPALESVLARWPALPVQIRG